MKKYVADTDYVVKVIARHVEKAKNNLKGSPIIVAGGYGVGSVSYTHLKRVYDEFIKEDYVVAPKEEEKK